MPLKDLRVSNPVDIAVYATARGIQDEPAFAWWVPWTLSGIEIPTSVAHAKILDSRNKNTFWQDAIRLEMSNIGMAFKILDPGENPPPGFTKSSGHMIYDVKMDFTRKARWVKDGHRTPDPEIIKLCWSCIKGKH